MKISISTFVVFTLMFNPLYAHASASKSNGGDKGNFSLSQPLSEHTFKSGDLVALPDGRIGKVERISKHGRLAEVYFGLAASPTLTANQQRAGYQYQWHLEAHSAILPPSDLKFMPAYSFAAGQPVLTQDGSRGLVAAVLSNGNIAVLRNGAKKPTLFSPDELIHEVRKLGGFRTKQYVNIQLRVLGGRPKVSSFKIKCKILSLWANGMALVSFALPITYLAEKPSLIQKASTRLFKSRYTQRLELLLPFSTLRGEPSCPSVISGESFSNDY